MNLLLAILVVAASSTGVEYRSLDGDQRFRPLERTSLLFGSVEFRLRGDGAEAFRVFDESVTPGGRPVILCEGTSDTPCVARFADIARRRLRVEAGDRVLTPPATLHASPTHESRAGAVVAYASAAATPPDEVTRTIRFESNDGYLADVGVEELEVKVPGVGEARVVALNSPDPETPKLIPILFDVGPYVRQRKRGDGIEWDHAYATRVGELRHALRRAASSGVDVEYVVVSYGADVRLVGPFRLHPGELDEWTRAETTPCWRRWKNDSSSNLGKTSGVRGSGRSCTP